MTEGREIGPLRLVHEKARVVAGGVASDVEGCPVNSGCAPEKSVSAVGCPVHVSRAQLGWWQAARHPTWKAARSTVAARRKKVSRRWAARFT
ncbi:hypothetical protein NL676_011202 [Syzygium grande]|nr:hypothetical protein NL676_011202 [Syzygium grande]